MFNIHSLNLQSCEVAVMGKVDSDLSDFCNWLLRCGVIDRDFEALLWTSNCPLDILFDQFRDGVILARLALLFEKEQESFLDGKRDSSVNYFLHTDGATFRREKNITFFLRVCSFVGVKRYFTAEELERDVNRSGLFKTMRLFSRKLEKRTRKDGKVIEGFEVLPLIEEKDKEKIGLDISYYTNNFNYKTSNYYNKTGTSSKDRNFYEKYLNYDDENLKTEVNLATALDESSALHDKILQLRQKEVGYQKKFLKTLEKIISSTANSEKSNLGDIFTDLEETLTPVKKLHKRFGEKLMKNVNPGPVFVEMKMEFWIYAPFIVLLTNALHLIETFERDASVKTELEMIKSEMRKEQDAGDSSFPGTLDQLFHLPMQHLANYGNHLYAIIKTAKKELSQITSTTKVSEYSTLLIRIVQRCIKAASCNDDILNYVNYSVGENSNKRIIRDLGCQLVKLNISTEDLATDYGSLVFEGKLYLKWETEKKYKNRYMLCMQKLILICDIVNERGKPTYYSPIRELHLFDPQMKFNVLETRDEGTTSSSSSTLQAQNLSRLTVIVTDRERNRIRDPFIIKTRNSSSFEILKKTLQNLFLVARISSKFHPKHTHDYSIHEASGYFRKPRVCGLEKCGNILSGQFIVGVYCRSCAKYYHNHCFITNSPETPYEDDIDLIRNLSQLHSEDESDNDDEDEINVNNIFGDFEEFKENIMSYKIGSCIIYFRDEKNGTYKLAYRPADIDKKAQIMKIVVSKNPITKMFRAEKMSEETEFSALIDLLKHFRTVYKFVYVNKTSPIEKADFRDRSGGSLKDFPEEIQHLLCLTDRKLALKGMIAGTYLIHPEYKDSSVPFAISVSQGVSSNPKRIPIQVQTFNNTTKYTVKISANQRLFDSVEELIEYYKHKCNLLYPLTCKRDSYGNDTKPIISEEDFYYNCSSDEEEIFSSDSSSSDISDVEEGSGKKHLSPDILRDLKNTEFYTGYMNRFDAKYTLLKIGIKGMYLLRVAPTTKELRVSLMEGVSKKTSTSTHKKSNVIHVKISIEEEDDDEGLKTYCYQMGQIKASNPKELIDIYQSLKNRTHDFKYPYSD